MQYVDAVVRPLFNRVGTGVRVSRHGMKLAIVLGVLAAAVNVTAVGSQRDGPHRDGREAAAAGREPKEPVHERTGNGLSEATSAAEEQVSERAYPKTYVESATALAAKRAYQSLPDHLSGPDFDPSTPGAASRGGVGGSWAELGPSVPQVPAAATYTGAPTLNSGRVTALAVDPHCIDGTTACRVFVGAAGGGVWRSDDAEAVTPAWSTGRRARARAPRAHAPR